MRTLVFSDIHGNLPAFEALLKHVGVVDRYVCLGDVVNYGPWSDECVDLLESLPNCDKLMGNHDEAFLSGRYPGKHPVARAFFDFCYPAFTRRPPLAAYRASCVVGDFHACHTLNDQYIFADTPLSLDQNYLIGHSHRQFHRSMDGFELYNAGSVGQNRQRLNIINCLVCGPAPRDVEMLAFPYDARRVIAEMESRHYPEICVAYYRGKTQS